MKVRPEFDAKAGLVALGILVATGLGAYFFKDPGLRVAWCLAAGGILSTVPSWLLTRNTGGAE